MKIDRLFAITNILLARKNVTARELAEEFQVSVRTIYRDIDILSTNGVPVLSSQGKGGGITLMEHYSIDKSIFTDEEQKEILLALQSLEATGQGLVGDSAMKLRGLFQKPETNWIEIDFTRWNQKQEDKDLFFLVRDGIIERRRIQFDYFNNKGEYKKREVEPLKLVFKYQTWYLYAFCLKRKDYRFFKLTRMEHVEKLEETFQREVPKQLVKEYQQPETEKKVSVTLKIKESMAFRIYDEFRMGDIKRINHDFIVQLEMPDDEWIFGYLLGFSDSLEVLEPEEFREKYRDYIKRILNKYL
ncbi:MAG: YafY family protein [Lachnospiraceae bacterium]|nr:YafY family protein [Lachnospiraceae bacterium]